MPEVRLDASDAAELTELLQFLTGWLARDQGRLGASLEDFVDTPAYGTQQLREDLGRFVFLLGGSGSEPPLRPMTGAFPASRGYAGPCGPPRRSSSR